MGKYSEYKVGLMSDFRIEKSGKPVLFLGHHKHEEFLAYVMLNARTPKPNREIAVALWPDRSEDLAMNQLYQTTHKVKAQLEKIGIGRDSLHTKRKHIFPDPSIELDVAQLQDLCRSVVENPTEGAEELIEGIRALYGDGLLPGLRTPWIEDARRTIRMQYEQALAAAVRVAGTSFIMALPPTSGNVVRQSPDEKRAEFRLAYGRLKKLSDGFERSVFETDREFWLGAVGLAENEVEETVQWAIADGEAEMAVDIAGRFWYYWYAVGKTSVGRRLADQALAFAGDRASKKARAQALDGAAVFAALEGDIEIGYARIEEAGELWEEVEDSLGIARSIYHHALVADRAGDSTKAIGLAYKSLSVHRYSGHPQFITKRLVDIARLERQAGFPERARNLIDEAAARIASQPTWIRAFALQISGLTRLDELFALDTSAAESKRIADTARFELRGAAEIIGLNGDRRMLTHTTRGLGLLDHLVGNLAAARQNLELACKIASDSGDLAAAGLAFRDLGVLTADEGDVDKGVTLIRRGLMLIEATGDLEESVKTQAKLDELLKNHVDA